MQHNIADIKTATQTLIDAPTHTAETWKRVFGENGGAYHARMIAHATRILRECEALEELNQEMKQHIYGNKDSKN